MIRDDLTPEQRATRGALWRESLDTLPQRLVEHVVERLARWAIPLSPEGLRLPRRAAECDLVHTTADVLAYARATLARVHLARGETIPRSWLAALAGVSLSTIEKAIRLDELATSKRRRARGDGGGKPAVDVDNASARAWLAARSVEGV